MPLLDDSVQMIGETSAASDIQAARVPSSPTNFAQLIQPAPLASMSSDLFRSRSRTLNFSIILNEGRTLISVTSVMKNYLFETY